MGWLVGEGVSKTREVVALLQSQLLQVGFFIFPVDRVVEIARVIVPLSIHNEPAIETGGAA
jgi:hypothetical protein